MKRVKQVQQESSRAAGPSLTGAEGARELIAFLTGAAADADIRRRPDQGGTERVLRLSRTGATPPPGASGTERAGTVQRRHVLRPAPHPARTVRPRVGWDTPGLLVITNDAGLAASAPPAADATVIVVEPGGVTARHPGGHESLEDLETDIGRLLASSRPRHIRVVVRPGPTEADTAGRENLLRLHTAVFLAARTCGPWLAGGTFATALPGGVGADHVPHPYTGLFTGLTKALAHELPDTDVFAVVSDDYGTAAAVRDLGAETGHERVYPVVHLVAGERLVMAARPEPAQPGPYRLEGTSVVVAAGGSRGIGAEMVASLARAYAPRIYVLGSNRLSAADPGALTGDDASFAARKPGFIRERVAAGTPVVEAKAEFERLVQAREIAVNLAELERYCGPGRATYVACDLRDPDAVRQTIAAVHAESGTVDLLLNIAGATGSAALEAKTLRTFTSVRDLKVRTYTHLKDAFGQRRPRRWLNCGSALSTFGLTGETDYSAANDFLVSAAQYAAARGADEFTMGWGLWGETGMGADPFLRSVMQANADTTPMTTAEGLAHFTAELALAAPPTTSFFGDREWELVESWGYPEFCRTASATGRPDPAPAPAPAPATASRFYADAVRSTGPGEVVVERTLDLSRDPYLGAHLVDGVPTVPGFFVPEMAAEAAALLVPSRVPVAFEDLRFASFLRLNGGSPAGRPVRVTARLVSSEEDESVVGVRVLADVVAPGGRVLVRDREHFSLTVRLRDAPRQAPSWSPWREFAADRLADPYCRGNPLVQLSGVFRCTRDTRAQPLGARARFVLDEAGTEPWLGRFGVPAVLLDGMVRLLAIQRVEGDWTPLFVPRSARRIELFGTPTDLSVARGGGAELWSTPAAADLESDTPNQTVAVGPDGLVVARVHDVRGAIRGYLHQETGEFVDVDAFRDRTGERTP